MKQKLFLHLVVFVAAVTFSSFHTKDQAKTIYATEDYFFENCSSSTIANFYIESSTDWYGHNDINPSNSVSGYITYGNYVDVQVVFNSAPQTGSIKIYYGSGSTIPLQHTIPVTSAYIGYSYSIPNPTGPILVKYNCN